MLRGKRVAEEECGNQLKDSVWREEGVCGGRVGSVLKEPHEGGK